MVIHSCWDSHVTLYLALEFLSKLHPHLSLEYSNVFYLFSGVHSHMKVLDHPIWEKRCYRHAYLLARKSTGEKDHSSFISPVRAQQIMHSLNGNISIFVHNAGPWIPFFLISSMHVTFKFLLKLISVLNNSSRSRNIIRPVTVLHLVLPLASTWQTN